ncbi:MAG: PilW family protein [Aquabacterium sp.]|uniref:PilW family protein n=1 Tax=Aquabacterium sp. TaxID=1872578 RepID=UPI0027265C53|nr:PilW family protein [Aquabacterium sp.]MDO9005178.1 PilW family protein [Aquabacterium sp.]
MKRTHGFTLIELMVGVALGLLATLVIAQVFLQSEGNKRAATSGSDAQVAGAATLFTLQRDIQAAGYGLTSWPDGLGCSLSASYGGTVILNPATDVLAPVVIGFGATASASDTITVMASGKAGYSVPIKVASPHGQTDGQFAVASNLGVVVNDLILAMPAAAGGACTLFLVSSVTPTTSITHATDSGWNASTGIFPSGGYAAGSMLLDLGANPVRRRYSVNTDNWTLQAQELLTATGIGAAQEVFPQVVLLKALYGKTAPTGGAVVTYSATPPVTNADWRLVQAIRLVIVARSAQYEREEVTSSSQLIWDLGPLTLEGVSDDKLGEQSTCNTTNQCVTLDVSASGPANEWRHYRYKIFDTVVALRNVMWNP